MEELERLQKEVIADRGRIVEGELRVPGVTTEGFDSDIAQDRNAVIVYMPEIGGAKEPFLSRYGSRVLLEKRPLTKPQCTRDDCYPGMRSGLRSNTPDSGGGYCSTGFTTTRPSGELNILTAGHCGQVGHRHRHGGQGIYGYVRARQVAGRVDAERVGPPEGGFNFLPRIFVNAGNKFHPVQSRGTWDGIVVNATTLCKSGVTTGKTCGLVDGKNFSPNWVSNGNRFLTTDYCSRPGDSGAGVYRNANWSKVEGLNVGGIDLPCGGWLQGGVVGHIEYTMNALGGNLLGA